MGMTVDQYTFQNPVDQYPKPEFQEQKQNAPGLASEMTPRPDHGEETYRGTGRLQGRKAIVTGADSGIGRATAIAYAREGADVLLSYLESETPDANEVAQLIKDAGQQAIMFPGDISQESVCRAMIEKAVSEFGQIDILVNVAGKQTAVSDLSELTTEQLTQTFATNVFSMYWLCQSALPHMKPGASIINTSSIQAYSPSPTLLDYAPTKAAINNFTKALAQSVAEKGIRVNVVAPGPIWTPLQVSGGQPTEKLPQFGAETPMARAGQPAELAPAYVYLASQESSYVTGETLNVNGGMPTP